MRAFVQAEGAGLEDTLTMKRYFPIALTAASIVLAGQVMAAEVDMSKLTCKEVADMPGAKPVAVAMWFNGYVHGQAGNVMLDGDQALADAEKLADYCRSNPDATLFSAIEALAKS
jgi:acid stress chaperone HdeB